MSRKSMLDILRKILKLLADKKERSIKQIAYGIEAHWETTLKALEFLKEVNLVEERKGNVTYKAERLFKIK